MAQQLKSEVVFETPVLTEPKSFLLKTLREKKKLSRSEVAKRTQLSTYQVEGLEGPGTQNLLNRFLTCAKALGYRADDVLSMVECGGEPSYVKGIIGKPLSETIFQEGVKLQTYLGQKENFLGLLELQKGCSLEMKQIYPGDLTLGIVREGTLIIDLLTRQTAHKKDSFFVLPGKLPVKFVNDDGFMRTAAILLFSVRFPVS